MSNDYCFDCVYSSCVNGMQACAWDDGLMNRRKKCDRYKKSWQKVLIPYLMVFIFFVFVTCFLLAIGL